MLWLVSVGSVLLGIILTVFLAPPLESLRKRFLIKLRLFPEDYRIEKSDLEALEKRILIAANKTLSLENGFTDAISAIEYFEMGDYLELTSNKALTAGTKAFLHGSGLSRDQAEQFYQINMGQIELETEYLEEIKKMIIEYRDKERHFYAKYKKPVKISRK